MALFPQKRDLFYPVKDHHFGMNIHPRDLYDFLQDPSKLRSLHLADTVGNKDPISILNEDGFQISLDVEQFSPNEITVKAVDNVVTVEGRHEEKEDDYGSVTRHFQRKYSLPACIEVADLVTTLSSDGILTLKAHKRGDGTVKVLNIQQTGPARHAIKHDRHVNFAEKADITR